MSIFIRDVASVNGEERSISRSHDAYREQIVKLGHRPGSNRYARLEVGQLHVAPAVERQVLDAGTLDDALNRVAVVIHLRAGSLHVHNLVGCAHLHRQIDRGAAAGFYRSASLGDAKGRLLAADFILARRKRRGAEEAFVVGQSRAHQVRRFVGNRDLGERHDRAGFVCDGSR